MTQEKFKDLIEHPIKQFTFKQLSAISDVKDTYFWTRIRIKATIGRTLRLALQYPGLAKEYLDSLPKATMD